MKTKLIAPALFLLLFISPLFAETVDVEYIQLNRQMRTCVGVLYSPDICLTVGHLTDFVEDEPVIIKRNRRAINGTIISINQGADIAVVKLEKKLKVPTLPISTGVNEGEEVFVDCFDRSRKMWLNGYGVEPLTDTKFLLFRGQTVELGMSGSPVYDGKGALVSIVSGYLHDKDRRTIGCMPLNIKNIIGN